MLHQDRERRIQGRLKYQYEEQTMRIYTTLALLGILSVSPAIAEPDAGGGSDDNVSASVPTGYKVPGCGFYKLINGTVHRICDTKDTRDPSALFRNLAAQAPG
jgi:hypothetical protein